MIWGYFLTAGYRRSAHPGGTEQFVAPCHPLFLTYECCPLVEPPSEQTTSQGAPADWSQADNTSLCWRVVPNQRDVQKNTKTVGGEILIIFPKMTDDSSCRRFWVLAWNWEPEGAEQKTLKSEQGGPLMRAHRHICVASADPLFWNIKLAGWKRRINPHVKKVN